MFWIGFLTGIVVGGNFGMIMMACFKINNK